MPTQHGPCSLWGPALPPPSPLRSCCVQGGRPPLGSLQSDIEKAAAHQPPQETVQGEKDLTPSRVPSSLLAFMHQAFIRYLLCANTMLDSRYAVAIKKHRFLLARS